VKERIEVTEFVAVEMPKILMSQQAASRSDDGLLPDSDRSGKVDRDVRTDKSAILALEVTNGVLNLDESDVLDSDAPSYVGTENLQVARA
jgi:hypothetical protein